MSDELRNAVVGHLRGAVQQSRTIRRLRALADGYRGAWKAEREGRQHHELSAAKAWRRYRELKASMRAYTTPRPRADWGEEDGPVLWWKLPVCEPPWVGGANDDDFPDYVTHWTPILDLEEP